jgi:hypothetical protein
VIVAVFLVRDRIVTLSSNTIGGDRLGTVNLHDVVQIMISPFAEMM